MCNKSTADECGGQGHRETGNKGVGNVVWRKWATTLCGKWEMRMWAMGVGGETGNRFEGEMGNRGAGNRGAGETGNNDREQVTRAQVVSVVDESTSAMGNNDTGDECGGSVIKKAGVTGERVRVRRGKLLTQRK